MTRLPIRDAVSAARLRRLIAAAATLVVFAAVSGCTQPSSNAKSALPASESDPRSATAFVKPADLAATLAGTGEKPMLLHVGFQVLYRGGAIPGSRYVGPGSTPEGLESLRANL